MSDYIEKTYAKISQLIQDKGLDDEYYIEMEAEAIEIYNKENTFVYASNDIDELSDNIEFLLIKREKNKKMDSN